MAGCIKRKIHKILREEEHTFPKIFQEMMNKMTEKCARWVCLECHYIYDPEKGDPKAGIPPGTPFEDLPETWRCPECKILKVKKGVFKRLDERERLNEV